MLTDHLRRFFAEHSLPACRIVAAVSGGADSSALLIALSELRDDGFEVVCGHVNHHLRGAESDEDERFARELSARLGVSFAVEDGTIDDAAVRERGVEAAAREVRYQRLHRIRDATRARFIATAHQQNDQAETVLMRLMTGSGVAGLRGIHPLRDDGVIRPILGATRAEVEAFLRERNIVARHDRSNDEPRFLRNRVRAVLRELGGIEQLAGIAAEARALWPIVERAIDDAAATVTSSESETRFASLPKDEWLRSALLARHIRRLDPQARDFDAFRIAREVQTTKRMTVTKNLELVREDDAHVLRKREAASEPVEFEMQLSENAPAHIAAIEATVHLARIPGSPKPDARSQKIQLPRGAAAHFTIRNRRPGDRFQPLGMQEPKKLKDFLIDRKIAAGIRDRLPLLIWNGEIVWIAGVEVSERFKVSTAQGDLYEVWLEGPGAADDRHHRGVRS